MNHPKVRLPGGLYFVATPIGAARDITLRALDILASAEVIAAEDTRSLRRLMEIHGVAFDGRRIVAYHDHSGPGTQARLVEALKAGQSVAYASEAGMPLIADPGFELNRAAREAGIAVTVAPGASAALTALLLSGLPTDAFFFAGFLPASAGARRKRLEVLAPIPGTLVVYESPRRLAASLRDMAQVLGTERQAAMCREMTKKFEEVRHGSLAALADELAGEAVKGEVVLVIDRGGSMKISESTIEDDLRQALEGLSVKDAAEMVAKAHDLPRRQVYQMALKLGG